MPVYIDRSKCNGCGYCYDICPGDIYTFDKEKREVQVTYGDECWHCGACVKDCPRDAIQLSLWWKVAVG